MAMKQQHDLTATLCKALVHDYEEQVHPQAGRIITGIPESIVATVLDAMPDGWIKLDGKWSHVTDGAVSPSELRTRWLREQERG